MTANTAISFLLNNETVRLDCVSASTTLLDFLRLQKRLTGSKEGCAEGDCGACTVLVGRLNENGLVYETVNACIRFLASLNGCHVVTVEHLRGTGGTLHPVQQAMVDHHGSQCGFCTPGIVMSLYALWMETPAPGAKAVETALQGNLCRCTGYQPILNAAQAISDYGNPGADFLVTEREANLKALADLAQQERIETGPEDDRAILPANATDLAEVLAQYPKATVIAGSTDVGLWVTKQMRPISPAVFIGHLADLKSIQDTEDALIIGAGVTYTESQKAISKAFPHLEQFWDRIAGWQVRNMGTIGGNIANGSPIGDTPPVLIALEAELTLRSTNGRRTLSLEDYFIAYGQQDLAAGEFVEQISIPKNNDLNSAYKISKRRDEDISSVCLGICVGVEDGKITRARLSYGGMAATPKRATQVETALIGQPWNASTLERAATVLDQDFAPITDMRASADYRQRVAGNLLRRFFAEHSGQVDVRLDSF